MQRIVAKFLFGTTSTKARLNIITTVQAHTAWYKAPDQYGTEGLVPNLHSCITCKNHSHTFLLFDLAFIFSF